MFFRQWGIFLPQDPSIPLLIIYPKDTPLYHKDTCSTMFMAAFFIIGRNWKQVRGPSTQKWIKKMWPIYPMGYYSAIKYKDIMNFTGRWMELKHIILTEVNQTQKDLHGVYLLISGY